MSEGSKTNDRLVDELNDLRRKVGELESRLKQASELGPQQEMVRDEVKTKSGSQEEPGETERLYRTLVETAKDVIWTVDLDLRYTYVSPSVKDVLGYTVEDIMAMRPLDGLTSDSRERVLRAFREELALEASGPRDKYSSRTEEIERYHKDGSTRWEEITTTFLRDSHGKPIGILGISHDITDRKLMEHELRETRDRLERRVEERTVELKEANEQLTREVADREKAEEALRASEAKYRFLAEQASDILWTVDLNMRTTYVSPSIEKVLGFTVEERLQQDVESQLTPDSLLLARQRLLGELEIEKDLGIRPDQSIVLDLEYFHKNGSVVCLESVMTFIRDETGIPIGVYGLSRDVTARKKAEDALRKSEEFNRRLVDHAPFGILYLAADGTIEYANPAANRIAGLPEDQVSPVVGQKIVELPGIKDRSKADEVFRELLEGRSVSDLEVPYKSSAGRETVLLVAAAPRFDSDGTVAGATLMLTDILERKKAENIQRQTARFRAVADLAGGVAHNFNNLLQIVIGHLELALLDLEAGDYAVVRDALEKVLKSSRFGAEVVRRLQSFSRQGNGVPVSEVEVFDVSDVARQAAEVSESWLAAGEKVGRKISLHTRLAEGGLVKADKNEVFGLVVNLVRNAVEALHRGGDIDLITTVEGDKVVLRVKDTGIGISQESLGRIFNPFFTTKAEPGAGLSLASGRKTVEDCGGQILVDSIQGQGATSRFRSPSWKGRLR